MNCEKIQEALVEILDGSIDAAQAQHIEACDACTELLALAKGDAKALASLPVAPVPSALLIGVMREVRKTNQSKLALRFFMPRLLPVAAAVILSVVSYNMIPGFMAPDAPPMGIRTTAEDQLQTFVTPPEGVDSTRSKLQLPANLSPWVTSSAVGVATFTLWGGLVYVWYRRRGG